MGSREEERQTAPVCRAGRPTARLRTSADLVRALRRRTRAHTGPLLAGVGSRLGGDLPGAPRTGSEPTGAACNTSRKPAMTLLQALSYSVRSNWELPQHRLR